MDYFINNALCLKAKKKKNFFLTIQYFRKSLKPVATAKRLIFYYLSEVQHESPAAQRSESFGPWQLADPTSTRGAPASADKMLSGGDKALGVVNKSPSPCCSQTKGAGTSPRGTPPWGQCCPPAHTATCGEGMRAGEKEGQVSASRAFLPPPVTGASFKVLWNRERPDSSREQRVD